MDLICFLCKWYMCVWVCVPTNQLNWTWEIDKSCMAENLEWEWESNKEVVNEFPFMNKWALLRGKYMSIFNLLLFYVEEALRKISFSIRFISFHFIFFANNTHNNLSLIQNMLWQTLFTWMCTFHYINFELCTVSNLTMCLYMRLWVCFSLSLSMYVCAFLFLVIWIYVIYTRFGLEVSHSLFVWMYFVCVDISHHISFAF